MYRDLPPYNHSEVHPNIIELINVYDDLVATQISLISFKKTVNKHGNKQLKEHLEKEQSQLIDEIDTLRRRLFSLQIC